MSRSIFLTLIVFTQLAGTAIGAQSAPPRFLRATVDSTAPSVEIDPSAWPAFSKRISITLDGVPRREALRRLASLSGMQFVYADDLIGAEETVKLEARNMPVSVALAEVLRGANVDVAVSRDGSAVLVRRQLSSSNPAHGMVDGLVVDDDLAAIGGADIRVLNTPVALRTSEGGRFRITDMAPGPYVVTVRKVGFQPLALVVIVAAADTARLNFTMDRMAVGLDTVRVTAEYRSQRLEEFERRRKSGMGNYITAAEIARLNSFDLGNVMRRIPGVFILRNPTTGTTDIETGRSHGFLYTCPMVVIVDEVPMPEGMDIGLLPSLKEIAAIEIYKSPNSVPMRYTSGRMSCGAVLIWTKDGS